MSNAQSPKNQFDIRKIYLKDASLEAPNSPGIFKETWRPEINLQINQKAEILEDDNHEVVITLTVTAKLGEKTAFLAEVQQAGIFMLKGFESNQLEPMLAAFCPNILFPYAREALDNLIGKSGFPPLMIRPVNFDAIYQQRLQAEKQKSQVKPS